MRTARASPVCLGTLTGDTISRARRINAAGEIVGEAQAADGFYHAVKWTLVGLPTTYCAGDGTGTACPCGNASAVGADEGCVNSLGLGGKLVAAGEASIGFDQLSLSGSRMPCSSALYFQGTTTANGGSGTVFGDGLRNLRGGCW